jgi:uncharacterized protein YegL
MIGAPMQAVQDGVRSLLRTLTRNPYALETVWLSVITFDVKARLTTPLTELIRFKPPEFSVKPGTALGAALKLLQSTIENDFVPTTNEAKGDYKPFVFILTDGQPTDDWKTASQYLFKIKSKIAYIYTIGCGEDVNFEIMTQFSDVCIHQKELTPEAMSKIFVWLSASIGASSAQINDGPIDLTKVALDKDLELVDLAKPPKFVANKWLFFHVLCSKKLNYYLARFCLEPKSGLYFPHQAHKLPEKFFDWDYSTADGINVSNPTVNANLVKGAVECPYCGNQGWYHCNECGSLLCLNIKIVPKQLICPKCGSTGYLSDNTDFQVDGSIG